MRRLLTFFFTVLLLAGCISKPSEPTITLDGSIDAFYAQKLEWSDCGNSLECSEFVVPVDYSDLSGETISIAINRHLATNQSARLGSIVINPGGPGGSGITYVEAYESQFTARLMKSFDIVGFDPRGVGKSAPIECTPAGVQDEIYASESTPDTAAEIKEYLKPLDMTECAADEGKIFNHVSTVEVVKDLDILRALLGEAQLNYLGKSYGTQIGAVYASMFPANVGHFVLDGAVDMKATGLELSLGQAAGFEEEFHRFARYCVQAFVKCVLGNSESDVLDRLMTFINKLDSKPLKTEGSRKLTESHAWMALIGSMYAPQWTWDWLIDSLEAAYAGDGTALLDMADWQAGRQPDGTYEDNSFDAFPAINCIDYPYEPFDRDQFMTQTMAVAPMLGRLFGWMEGGCKDWPGKGIPMPADISAAANSANPILVVGTVYDPATPVQWARNLTEQLGNARYLEFTGDGHTAYVSGSRCIDYRIDKFFTDGELPPEGLKCLPDTVLVS